MDKNQALIELCQHMLREFELIDDWERLIAVGDVGNGRAGMFGYSFDSAGKSASGAPKGFETLRALKRLHQAMACESPTGRPWLACLLRIGSNGEVGADFEYADAERWAVKPGNLEQRIAEFAAMPV